MAEKRGGAAMAGFVVFAGGLMMVIGLINIFQGFIALFSDQRVAMTRRNLVIVNVNAWGWVLTFSGLALLIVGAGLLVAQTWARITGIVLVCLHAVTQVLWLGAYPVWSLLMFALDVIVLYALTARWSDVRDRIGGDTGVGWSGQDQVELSAAEERRPFY